MLEGKEREQAWLDLVSKERSYEEIAAAVPVFLPWEPWLHDIDIIVDRLRLITAARIAMFGGRKKLSMDDQWHISQEVRKQYHTLLPIGNPPDLSFDPGHISPPWLRPDSSNSEET